MSEEWSEPFSTMVSPSWFCGVGERDRFRRMGEQAGVLRLELLAVLRGQMETGNEVRKRRKEGRLSMIAGQRPMQRTQPAQGAQAEEKTGERGPARDSLYCNAATGQQGAVVPV